MTSRSISGIAGDRPDASPGPPTLAGRRADLMGLIRDGKAAGITRMGLMLAYGFDDPAMDQDLRQLIGAGKVVIRESGWTGERCQTYFASEWEPTP